MATAQTFKTADEAIEQLLREGFSREDYDPMFPFVNGYNDGDGIKASVTWDARRERYIIVGVRL